MTLLFAAAVAFGADSSCPWTYLHDVSSTMTTVSMNGETRSVRGLSNRNAFASDLLACGLDDAAWDFARWRERRRVTNVLVATGVIVTPWILVGVPFAATAAGRSRLEMEHDLLEWEGRPGVDRPPPPPATLDLKWRSREA